MGSICSPDDVNTQSTGNPIVRRAREDGVGQDLTAPLNGKVSSYSTADDRVEEESPGTQIAPADGSKKKGFQIVVSPPDPAALTGEEEGYANASKPSDSDSNDDDEDYKDSTIGGQVSWRKVADFSALLPYDVKLKLWNGVFKSSNEETQPELKRICKVLRTFVMLQLTREYKKSNSSMPPSVKQRLPAAVKHPGKFIEQFMKRDQIYKDTKFRLIYETISERFNNADEGKKEKYAKKLKITQDNFAQLTQQKLSTQFNRDDFLRTSFLQYMLYAYQMFKLDE